MVNDKKTGSFFTPAVLAEAIVKRIETHLDEVGSKPKSILEPSVGEGAFIRAILSIEGASTRLATIDVVDIEPAFIDTCRKEYGEAVSLDARVEDFINYVGRGEGYDVILGNPPYVSYKQLAQKQINSARDYFIEQGLKASDFRNIWTLFLLKASRLLKATGVMAFVLPKEVIYVNHASWLRASLLKDFARVEVFLFDELHFDHADQDVAVIICYRSHGGPGLYMAEGRGANINFNGLRSIEVDPFYGSKWSQFKISDSENALLHRCSKRFQSVQSYCTAVAGIVPAANSFFILPRKRWEGLGLDGYVLKIVQRSNYIGKSLIIDAALVEEIAEAGQPVGLLANYDHMDPPKAVSDYLASGEAMGLKERYKMIQRKPWHKIPGVWASDAVFFKRIGELPKFALNETQVMVTDTAYRVTPLDGVDIKSLIFSFYNSVTMVAAELQGRTYGGGVLELTPNEFKKLPIPYTKVSDAEFEDFIARVRNYSFTRVLAEQDEFLLSQARVGKRDIVEIQRVRQMLFTNRNKKGRAQA